MARFTPSFLEEIKERIPIADVVGRRVTFDKRKSQPAKGDFWACCPFHGEKTPSFHCENSKGRYHCFGCGVSGDHFRFMTELDGISFPEAVERLANEAGVPMPISDPKAIEREKQKATLFDVMELAAKFFQDALQTAAGATARSYLRDRGLSQAVQNHFGLGYAPQSRNALKEFLASKNIPKEQIEACGLVVHGPDIAVSYDRFRDRIMFPITDPRGRVIAFGGRALSSDVPAKYLNSPETELFSKSNVLFNLGNARRAAAKSGTMIVAEGYMDVIAMHAAGIEHAVAPLGTALTPNQLNMAWKSVGEPVLCFDGDEAGLRAAHRSIDVALPALVPGRSMRFALLPQGQDPDDVIRQSGVEALKTVLNEARPLADMIWSRETGGKIFDTPERRAELEANLSAVTKSIQNEAVRRHYEQDMRDRLSGFFGSEEASASGRSQAGGRRNTQQNARRGRFQAGQFQRGAATNRRFAVSDTLMNSPLVKRQSALPPLRETALVITIANHPAVGIAFFEEFCELEFEHPWLKKLAGTILDVFASHAAEPVPPTLAEMRDALLQAGHETELKSLENQVQANRIWQALPESAFEDARDGWKQAYGLHLRARSLNREMKAAEEALAQESTQRNYDRLLQIQRELADSEGTEALIEGFGIPSGRPSRSF
ncbi:MAG: DNA primase [Pseudomonadota bacterium]